jgi:WD40 repeat protein
MSGHELNIAAIGLSPDEKILASGGRDYTVRVWDVETAKETAKSKIPRNVVTSMCWVPREQLLVQGSEDLRLRTWDSRTMSSPAQVIEGYTYFPLCIDVSADGNYVLTSSKGFDGVGCEGRIYDRRQGKLLHTLDGHTQDATSCCFLAQPGQAGEQAASPLAVTASKDHTIRLWDITSGSCVGEHLQPDCNMFTGLAAPSPESPAQLYASSYSGNLYIYTMDQFKLSCVARTERQEEQIF